MAIKVLDHYFSTVIQYEMICIFVNNKVRTGFGFLSYKDNRGSKQEKNQVNYGLSAFYSCKLKFMD